MSSTGGDIQVRGFSGFRLSPEWFVYMMKNYPMPLKNGMQQINFP
jgi:hypothetical protein